MKSALLLICFLLTQRSLLWAQSFETEGIENFLKTHRPITQVLSPYEIFPKEEEEEIDSEMEFQNKHCKFETIKRYAEILSKFSKVDGLLALKSCNVTKEKKIKLLEDRIKQQIFLLSKFPKLEIIPNEKKDPNIDELTTSVSNLWEERVYLFSNFYHGHSLIWLGEEKEISEEINRVLYTEMNEKRKISLLKKMADDLKATNLRIYHLFQFSSQNPFYVTDLEAENKKSKETLENYFFNLFQEDIISPLNREKIRSINVCLSKIEIKNSHTRLTSILGFWQDYAFLAKSSQQNETKENQSIWKFLKKNIYNSHHFERRLENGLNICERIAESNELK